MIDVSAPIRTFICFARLCEYLKFHRPRPIRHNLESGLAQDIASHMTRIMRFDDASMAPQPQLTDVLPFFVPLALGPRPHSKTDEADHVDSQDGRQPPLDALPGQLAVFSQTRGWVGILCGEGGLVYHGRLCLRVNSGSRR